MEDKKIIVFYVGVGDMETNQVGQYIDQIKKAFFTEEFAARLNCEMVLIPTREINSKLECINPKYITNQELIDEHKTLMIDYLEQMNKFIEEKGESKND